MGQLRGERRHDYGVSIRLALCYDPPYSGLPHSIIRTPYTLRQLIQRRRITTLQVYTNHPYLGFIVAQREDFAVCTRECTSVIGDSIA